MGTVTINGTEYQGKSISIKGGLVTIDGIIQKGEKLSGVVEIKISGILNDLHTDASVYCSHVQGNVTAGGSVLCEHVHGNISSGGSVKSGFIGGNVRAGGTVQYN
jgi:hypothetical protein